MNIAELSVVFGAKMEQFDRAMQSFERKLEKAGSKAKETGDMLSKTLTAPIVGIAGAMAFAIKKTADYADEIDKMSIRTELSRERLQELEFVTSQTGVSMSSLETSVDSLRRRLPQIESGTGRAAENFARLGINVRNTQGEMRPMNDIFDEALLKLSQVENRTERGAMAMDIFGRSASQLAPLLDQGADGIEALSQRARELGLVMGDEMVAELVEFNDAMDAVRKQGGAVAREFAMALLPLIKNDLIPFMQNTAIPVLRGMAERFQALDDSTKRNVIVISGLVAAIGPALSLFGRLAPLLGASAKAFRLLTAAMMANPYLAIGAAVLGFTAHIINKNRQLQKSREETQRLLNLDTATADFSEFDNLRSKLREITQSMERFKQTRDRARNMGEHDEQIRAVAEANIKRLEEQRLGIIENIKQLGLRKRAEEDAAKSTSDLTDFTIDLTGAYEDLNAPLKELNRVYDDLILRFNAGLDVMDDLGPAIKNLHEEHAIYGAKLKQLTQDIINASDEEVDALFETREEYLAKRKEIENTIQAYRELYAEIRTARTAQERQESNTDAVRDRQEESEWFDRLRNAVVGVHQEIKELEDDTDDLTEVWMMFGEMANDALEQAVFQAKSLEQVLSNILKQLASQALRGLIMGGIGALTGGGTFASGFLGAFGLGGQRASGGFARAGSPMLVGERGPEIVTMGANSTVTPLQNIRGGTTPQRIDIHIHGTLGARGRDLVYTIDEYRRLQG